MVRSLSNRGFDDALVRKYLRGKGYQSSRISQLVHAVGAAEDVADGPVPDGPVAAATPVDDGDADGSAPPLCESSDFEEGDRIEPESEDNEPASHWCRMISVTAEEALARRRLQPPDDTTATPIAGAPTPAALVPDAAERERPERALCIRKRWLDMMLAGEKLIEIRSRRHSFAGDLVYLVETKTGFVRATARFGEARPLTQSELQTNAAALLATGYKTPHAWPIMELSPLPPPHWIVTSKARFNMTSWMPRSRWEQFPSDRPENLAPVADPGASSVACASASIRKEAAAAQLQRH